jgi:DNA-binding CsgD family transcriptional regulator
VSDRLAIAGGVTPGSALAAELAGLPDGAARTFAVDDEVFVMVAEPQWLALEAGPQSAPLRERACGSLVVGSVRFVVLNTAPTRPSPTAGAGSLFEVLTRREIEIAWRIAAGASNKDIGRGLGISHFTVREHVRRICHKLGVRSRSCVAAAVGQSGFTARNGAPRPAQIR